MMNEELGYIRFASKPKMDFRGITLGKEKLTVRKVVVNQTQ